jgi:hypothetical protein
MIQSPATSMLANRSGKVLVSAQHRLSESQLDRFERGGMSFAELLPDHDKQDYRTYSLKDWVFASEAV